ncbi:hypothetical protein MMC15_006949 [Xylographa vitiligo]|nr:hypothetical protein [Xylographa vitiligo]
MDSHELLNHMPDPYRALQFTPELTFHDDQSGESSLGGNHLDYIISSDDTFSVVPTLSYQPNPESFESSSSTQDSHDLPTEMDREMYPRGNSKTTILDNKLMALMTSGNGCYKTTYSETEIHDIQSLLKHANQSWSRAPRTYIILRMLNKLELFDGLLMSGFTDHWFPVTREMLPSFIAPVVKTMILDMQTLVLSKAIYLEKGREGQHANFLAGEHVPFQMKGILGRGRYGIVEKVLSTLSYKEYARKLIRRDTFFVGAARSMQACIAELAVVKRLQHRHVVSFIGSYTDPSYVALLILPVADCNLAGFYELAASSKDSLSLLRSYFGCLSTALAYLHDERVRHKDIKPQNILVCQGNILFTDFGLSRDSLDASQSVSEGMTAFSPRYCAPEVAAFEPREYSSDIWSLGCVFLEMVSVLKGHSIKYMQEYLNTHGSHGPFVRGNESGTQQFIAALLRINESHDSVPLRWIETMLQINRFERVKIKDLTAWTTAFHPELDSGVSFSGVCCMQYHCLSGTAADPREEETFLQPVEAMGLDIVTPTIDARNRLLVLQAVHTRSAPIDLHRPDSARPTTSTVATRQMTSTAIDIERVLKPQNTNRQGASLLCALRKNDTATVIRLLASGADPNYYDNKTEKHLLHIAAEAGYFRIAVELINLGALLDTKAADGRTVLMSAASSGSAGLVSLLLAKQMSPLAIDDRGRTALSYAAEDGSSSVVRMLLGLKGIDPNMEDHDGGTALSWAAWTGKTNVVELLLEGGADADVQDIRWGRTPISWASECGSAAVVKRLLESKDVDPDRTDNVGRAPLSHAAEHGKKDVVILLIAHEGVNPIRKDKSGSTALDYAKRFRRKDLFSILSACIP